MIYGIYFQSKLDRKSALKKITSDIPSSKIRDEILNFIRSSNRGII